MKHGADNIVTAGMTAMNQKPKQYLGLNISTRVCLSSGLDFLIASL